MSDIKHLLMGQPPACCFLKPQLQLLFVPLRLSERPLPSCRRWQVLLEPLVQLLPCCRPLPALLQAEAQRFRPNTGCAMLCASIMGPSPDGNATC